MQENSQTNSMRLYRRLWRYLSDDIPIFITSILAMLVVAATMPAFASLIVPMINDGFVHKNLSNMGWIAAAIVGLFLIRGVFNVINEYLTGLLSAQLRMQTQAWWRQPPTWRK